MEFNELFRMYLDSPSFQDEFINLASDDDYNNFAKKYDIPYTLDEMKTLVQEKAESANCGSGGDSERTIGRNHFYGHIGQYSVTGGNYYYFTEDGKDHWYYGWCSYSETVEYTNIFGVVIKRIQESDFDVYIENNVDLKKEGKDFNITIKGNDWTAYASMNIV